MELVHSKRYIYEGKVKARYEFVIHVRNWRMLQDLSCVMGLKTKPLKVDDIFFDVG